jgi:hypothetical protein
MRQTTVDTFDTYLAATSKTLTNKTIDADNNTLSNIEVDNLKSGVLDTDLSSVAGTDTTLASAKAIKAYVDAQIQTEDTLEELNDTNISSLASGHILIYDGSDSFDNKAISGDITLASTGAVTIANNAVETAMVNENVVSGQTAISSGDVNITNDTLLLHDADASALKKVTVTNLISSAGGLTEVVADTSPQLGGNLDMNGNDIVTTSNADIDLAPNGTGKVVVKGNDNPGTIVFNCESNSHGQTVKSQPHSASVTNVLTLPPGGDQEIVGTTATQTLTNKTIDASQLSGTVANARLDAQLQDVAGLAVTNGNFIVGDGSNFVAESGSTARASLGLGTAAVTDTGISNGNVAVFTSGAADNDFLRIDGTSIEGRSASEVLSDIGGQAALTFGISNTNAVKIDSSSVADDEYARFTANGLESRSVSEVASDIGAATAGFAVAMAIAL